jgi:tetratricopeptide (TPR) repeat protein
VNAKNLLLGLTIANLVGIGGFMINRRLSHDAVDDAPKLLKKSSEKSVSATFALPPRPIFEMVEPVTPMQTEIAALRNNAFEIAEFTNKRLKDSPGALCLLGKLHSRGGDIAGARLIWDRVQELDGGYVELYLDLGHFEEKQGQLERSQAFFEKAIELAPQTLEAYDPLVEVLQRQAKFAEATARLTQRLSYDANSVNTWCSLGRNYQQIEDYAKAKQSFQKALAIDEHSHVAALGLMAACRSLGDAANADAAAEIVARNAAVQIRSANDRNLVQPDREKMQALLEFTAQTSAELLVKAGDSVAAIAQLEQSTVALPNSRRLRKQLLDIYLSKGEVERAIKVLRDAAEASPQDPERWLELGTVCLQTRRFDASEEALRHVIELVPNSDRAYALLAQTQMPANRNPKAAVASARRAVEIAPNAGNHYILATAFYNSGDIASTKAELNIAITLAPGNAEYIDALRRIQ